MRTANEWLDIFSETHAHPFNQWVHKFATPLVMLGVLGILMSVHPLLAYGAGILMLVFYVRLSLVLAAGMALFIGTELLLLWWMSQVFETPLWLTSSLILFVATIAQLIGHRVEGEGLAAKNGPGFILVAPMWIVSNTFRRFGFSHV